MIWVLRQTWDQHAHGLLLLAAAAGTWAAGRAPWLHPALWRHWPLLAVLLASLVQRFLTMGKG